MSPRSGVSWNPPTALDRPIACSPCLDTSTSHTQHHLWKLSPTYLATIETCYQSSDKLVWIIRQSMSQSCLKYLWGHDEPVRALPQIPPKGRAALPAPGRHCAAYVQGRFRFRESQTAAVHGRFSPILSETSVIQGFCFSPLHQL